MQGPERLLRSAQPLPWIAHDVPLRSAPLPPYCVPVVRPSSLGPMPKLKPYDPLAAVRRNAQKVTRFLLNPADLRNRGYDCAPLPAFPRELLECENLRSLEIFRGLAGRNQAIPDDLHRLAALEKLTLGGLAIKTLPDGIGRLRKLRELHLDYNPSLTQLPAAIGDLGALEELSLSETGVRELPAAIGKLKKLRRLNVSEKTQTVPRQLFDLPSLEVLDIRDVKSLPPGLGRLTSLTELWIDARALAGAGAEIGKLTKLESLFVCGRGKAIPAEVFTLPALKSLQLSGVGLATLPRLDALARLQRLDVSGNALKSLAATIAVLPALKTLEFSGNPLPLAEKRAVDALMKLSPSKRRKAAALEPAGAAAQKKVKAKADAPKAASKGKAEKTTKSKAVKLPTGLRRLGDVVAPNAALALLVAEAEVAARYTGEDGEHGERASAALERAAAAELPLGKGRGVLVSLGVGQGTASVWSAENRLVVVEAIFQRGEDDLGDDDRVLFHEFVLAKPTKQAKKVGSVVIHNDDEWCLVIAPTNDDLSDVAKLLKKDTSKLVRPCGAEGNGLLLDVLETRYDLLLEPPVKSAWGSGRRLLLVPV